MSHRFGVLPGFLVVLDDALNGLIECDQQRHVAADDLGQDSGCGADLRFTAAVGDQPGENLGADASGYRLLRESTILVSGEFDFRC